MSRLPVGGAFPKNFPGGTYNRLVDLLEQLEGTERFDEAARVSIVQQATEAALSEQRPWLPVIIENDTGAALVELAPVAIKEPSFDYPDLSTSDRANAAILGPQVLAVESAVSSTPVTSLAFTLQPIGVGKPGRALVMGLFPARVDIQSESDTTCAVQDSDAKTLIGGSGSIPIVWKPSGTGQKWCLVMLGGGGGGTTTAAVEQGPAILCETLTGATFDDAANRATFGEGKGYLLDPATGDVLSDGEPPALVGSDASESTTARATIDLTWPTGVAEGDVAILVAFSDTAASAAATPAGFTAKAQLTGGDGSLQVFEKTLDGTEAGVLTLTGASAPRGAFLRVYSNVEQTGDYLTGTTSVPAKTTTRGNSLLLRIAQTRESGGGSWTDTGAGALVHDLETGAGGVYVAATEETVAAEGANGAESWVHSDTADEINTVCVDIQPNNKVLFRHNYSDTYTLDPGAGLFGWYIKAGQTNWFFPDCLGNAFSFSPE